MPSEVTGALIGLAGAVFGAVVTGVTSVWTFRRSQATESADELRAVLQQLVDLRIQTNEVARRYAEDVVTQNFLSTALNNKRQLHKATAARILPRASEGLTANDYVTLAQEYLNDSEFQDALKFYQAALKAATGSRLERVVVLRGLGTFLLQPTVLHDRAKAEAYFREAIGLTNGQPDDYSRYTTGYTYQMLGVGLLANRYPEWKTAIEAARENYEAMNPTKLRQNALANLQLVLDQPGSAVPLPPAKPPLSLEEATVLERAKADQRSQAAIAGSEDEGLLHPHS